MGDTEIQHFRDPAGRCESVLGTFAFDVAAVVQAALLDVLEVAGLR